MNEETIRRAILCELSRHGFSLDPDDHEPGIDDWQEVIIFDDDGRPTHWDANVYDRDGTFTVTAYPLYFVERARENGIATGEWKGKYEKWITCLEIEGVQE
jgi:hypothetical protein